MSNIRREFYSNLLAQKYKELNAVESQITGTLNAVDEQRLRNQGETILDEIDDLDKKLSELDSWESNSNVQYVNLEKSFHKIDFNKAKEIAQSINKEWGENSGAILIFLQRSTKQKGDYCINEFLDLIVSDRKFGDKINGDYRPYPIDLGSPISEFNEAEFSKILASYINKNNAEKSLNHSIQKLCSSLKGGSIIFIRIENWDSVIEPEVFLDWFMENFWKKVIAELELIFDEYSKIRFIVALVAKSKVLSDCCSLDYFCSSNTLDHRKILELPLPDWTVKDIQNWLTINLGLSKSNSLQEARKIHRESEGTPYLVCSILERISKEKKINVC